MDISSNKQEKSWILRRKGNLQNEIESFQIEAQNKPIRKNYIKVNIDKT